MVPHIHYTSAMAAAFWFRAFLVVSLLLLSPSLYDMAEGFQPAEMECSVEQVGKEKSAARKLLMLGGMLDYDDTGANPKHDPRKKPGKP